MSYISFFKFFKRFYLFLERGKRREKKRERNINVWLLFEYPLLEAWPAPQACFLTGNWTSNTLVCRPALNQLSHTSQGRKSYIFFKIHKSELKGAPSNGQWPQNSSLYPTYFNTIHFLFCTMDSSRLLFMINFPLGGKRRALQWARNNFVVQPPFSASSSVPPSPTWSQDGLWAAMVINDDCLTLVLAIVWTEL